MITIANQCPISGGNAVFRARTLYALVNEETRYNDFDICGLYGIELRQPFNDKDKGKRPLAKLYPNPANEEATLEYELPEQAKGEFSLFSATGQQWLRTALPGGRSAYQFSTRALLPGVYHYLLKSGEMPVYFGKFVIIR